jgi:hypothetical protein
MRCLRARRVSHVPTTGVFLSQLAGKVQNQKVQEHLRTVLKLAELFTCALLRHSSAQHQLRPPALPQVLSWLPLPQRNIQTLWLCPQPRRGHLHALGEACKQPPGMNIEGALLRSSRATAAANTGLSCADAGTDAAATRERKVLQLWPACPISSSSIRSCKCSSCKAHQLRLRGLVTLGKSQGAQFHEVCEASVLSLSPASCCTN